MPNRKPPYKWAGLYAAVAIAGGAYGTWTLLEYELFPSFLQDKQTWFIDMYDSVHVKAYAQPMRELPEGVVSMNAYNAPFERNSEYAKSLTNPYEVNADLVAQGEWSFQTYCSPCHSADASGAGPVNDMSDGKSRFPVPAPALAGSGSVISAANYTEGHVYATVRYGGAAVMPGYDWAMTDQEMWSIVAYIGTLDGVTYGTYAPPAPAPEEG